MLLIGGAYIQEPAELPSSNLFIQTATLTLINRLFQLKHTHTCPAIHVNVTLHVIMKDTPITATIIYVLTDKFISPSTTPTNCTLVQTTPTNCTFVQTTARGMPRLQDRMFSSRGSTTSSPSPPDRTPLEGCSSGSS